MTLSPRSAMPRRRRRLRFACRRGAALVEFAICLPVIVILILGSLETCNAIFMRQALAVSAYEAVRVAIRKNGGSADAAERANLVLAARDIEGGTVVFEPVDVSSAPRGAYITATVSASFGNRAFLLGSALRGRLITSSATMVKE